MTFQEMVEGNSRPSTVARPPDFVDWGRRWGTNETEAQILLQSQWDDILHHLMGKTAATEVWPAQESGTSSSSHMDENSKEVEPSLNPCPEGENHMCREPNSTQLGQARQNAEDDEDQED